MKIVASAVFFLSTTLLSYGGASAFPAPYVHFHGVGDGQTVTGPVTFATDVGSSNYGQLNVTYILNGRPYSGPIALPPYTLAWDSRSLWDGIDEVQAVVRDAAGKPIAQSDVVPFSIANGDATVTMVSPTTTAPAKGTIKWEVQAQRPLPDAEIAEDKAAKRDAKQFEALLFALDGTIQAIRFGTPHADYDLDTTTLPNGPHELFVVGYAGKLGIPAVAMTMHTVDVDNGHTLMDVRPRWRDLYLAPGGRLALAPYARYTDSLPGPLPAGITYTSDKPDVATVDGNGVVSAVRSGVATVTLTAAGRTSTARILVDPPHGFPHLSTSGQILTEYDPKKSLFVRTLFFLNGDEVARLPGLDDQLKYAGVNTLTSGFYYNPGDQHATDFASWRRGWEPWIDGMLAKSKAQGFSMLLTGDDIARSTRELANSVQNPWSAQAIQLAFTKARDSGNVAAIEMIDEASGSWGGTPHPTNGAWLNRTPPVADDAFTKLMATIDAVPNRPAITWPVLGISGPGTAHNWEGDPTMSDYATHYWDILDWRRVYPWGASLSQEVTAMGHAVIDRYPVLMHDKPIMLLTSITGPYYSQGTPSPEFAWGNGHFIQDGPRPVDVTAEIMYGVAMGMAGIRAYGYDWSLWKSARATGAAGSEEQTGSDPFVVGTDRWWAMASAFTLIDRLTPWLFQPQASALDLGPNFVTGARVGPRGKLFMALNGLERSNSATVDLTPYRASADAIVTRMRITGATTETDTLPRGAKSDTVTFRPGETVVYLSPAPVAPSPPTSVEFIQPLPDIAVNGSIDVQLNLGSNSKRAVTKILIDGKVVKALSAGQTKLTVDVSTLKNGVWHCLAAETTLPNGSTGEARTTFMAVSP